MTTTIEKCPTCGASVTPNGDELNKKLCAIEKAIKKYYLALDRMEHGGVAEQKAFAEIQAILEMHWERGQMTRFLDEHPKLKPLYV